MISHHRPLRNQGIWKTACGEPSKTKRSVAEPLEGFALPRGAIPLKPSFVDERFGPAPRHVAAPAAAHTDVGVGAEIPPEVPEDRPRRAGRHDDGEGHSQSRDEAAGADALFDLVGKLRREEKPPFLAQPPCAADAHGSSDDGGLRPCRLGFVRVRTADLELVADAPGAVGLSEGFQDGDFPARPRGFSRRKRRVKRPFGLEAEAGAMRDLREGRASSETPDGRLKEMFAFFKGDLICLIRPVLDRSAMRATRDILAVQTEEEAFVGCDVEDERLDARREGATIESRLGLVVGRRNRPVIGVRDPGGVIDRLDGEDPRIAAREAGVPKKAFAESVLGQGSEKREGKKGI